MRSFSLLLAAALPTLGLIELGLHFFFANRPPQPDAWASVRPRLEALKQPGDLVLIAPRWIDPHARAGLGEGLLPLRDLARPEEARYRRVLELGALGERAPEVGTWRTDREEALPGGLHLRVLVNPAPVQVVRDLTDEVEQGRAEAAWIQGAQKVDCPLREHQRVAATGLFSHPTMPARRYVCGAHPWQSVAVTVQDDQQFRPRRCIWMHPPSGGVARLRFPAGPMGKAIRGHGGIHWTLEREQRGAPVTLEFWVDGQRVGEVRHEDGQGWALFEIPLGEVAHRDGAVLEARVSTGDASERHFCWEAALRE